MNQIKTRFQSRLNHSILNTSYPLRREDWVPYLSLSPLPFSKQELSFYIHIPFCQKICRFCEYVKYKCSKQTQRLEHAYLSIIEQDVNRFLNRYPSLELQGFDIGGGTPTALNDGNFEYLMHIFTNVIRRCRLSASFVPSIEATFGTINEGKIKMLTEAGIKRISFGLQVADVKLLDENNRSNGSLQRMQDVLNLCRNYGIELINIDLMYGFASQTLDDCMDSLAQVAALDIDHLTLYELRTNMLHQYAVADEQTRYVQYACLYQQIKLMGYRGRFGQNTFSRCGDLGLSSYLQSRMIDNGAYKGFGIAAQSKSELGVSYNVGKSPQSLHRLLSFDSFREEDCYLLPPDEMLAKYLAIAGYFGSFKLSKIQSIVKVDPMILFGDEFDFLSSSQFVDIEGDMIHLTPLGFKHYGAILSLFYPSQHLDFL